MSPYAISPEVDTGGPPVGGPIVHPGLVLLVGCSSIFFDKNQNINSKSKRSISTPTFSFVPIVVLLSRRIFFRVFCYMSSEPTTTQERLESLKSILINVVFAVAVYIIICLCVSLYARFVSDRGDPSSMWYKFPKWVQPASFWKKTVGIETSTYSYTPSSIAVSTTAITDGTVSNVTVSDCILACEAAAPDCVGFRYNTSSNTCYLSSLIDGIIPSTSSNVMYYIDGAGPTKQYIETSGKLPGAPVPISISAISIPTATNVATFTTTTHTFKTGNLVTIAGAGAANGSNLITVTDSTHFTMPYKVTTDFTGAAGGTATLVLTTIPPRTDVTSMADCAKACFSNVTCTGFSYAPQQCLQYTTALTTDMLTLASATSNTYLPGAPILTSYTESYS